MKSGLAPFVLDIFSWNKNMSKGDVFIRGMMLFNILFFLSQFEILVQLFFVLQMLVALYFIRFFTLKGLVHLPFLPMALFMLLLLWTIFICRNCFSTLKMATHFLFLPYNYVCLLMPFILIPFAKLENLPKYLKFIIKTIKLSVVLLVLLSPYMIKKWQGSEDDMAISRQLFEVINLYLNGGLMFAILMQKYLTKKDRLLVNIAAFLSIICAAYFARRGVLLSYLVTVAFTLLINLHFRKYSSKFFTILKYAIVVLIVALFVLSFGELLFTNLYERMEYDSRSGVELELLDQMTTTGDMTFGRGYAGSYYSEFIDPDGIEREGIETGYLHLILKGGIVYLVLMSLTFIPAVILGFFKSKNYYMKMLSCFALIFIIFFNVANSNITFSIRYFMFLIVIHILYNPKYRKMSDKEVENCLISIAR